MIEQLADKVEAWTKRREQLLIDSTVRLIGELMVSWVQLVLDSAAEARQSPIAQIIADGKYIGWRRWGNQARSEDRMRARIVPFIKLVLEARKRQLAELDRGR